MGAGVVPYALARYWEHNPYIGLPCPTVIQGEVLSLYCNLIWHALLIPKESWFLCEQKQRRSRLSWGNVGEAGKE